MFVKIVEAELLVKIFVLIALILKNGFRSDVWVSVWMCSALKTAPVDELQPKGVVNELHPGGE